MLTVSANPYGVSSDPAGVMCGPDGGECTAAFPYGTHVKIAHPLMGGLNCYFVVCTVTPTSAGTCDDILMDQDVSVGFGCYNP